MAAFSATIFHNRPISSFPHATPKISHLTAQSIIPPLHASADPDKDKVVETANDEPPKAVAPTPTPPKKPVYSMKKGQIVRVDKEKYLNSINYLSVGHPPYYKGLDYIYEDRGEVLDIRIFETGEYALASESLMELMEQSKSSLSSSSSSEIFYAKNFGFTFPAEGKN